MGNLVLDTVTIGSGTLLNQPLVQVVYELPNLLIPSDGVFV
jgi:hypothetical protein